MWVFRPVPIPVAIYMMYKPLGSACKSGTIVQLHKWKAARLQIQDERFTTDVKGHGAVLVSDASCVVFKAAEMLARTASWLHRWKGCPNPLWSWQRSRPRQRARQRPLRRRAPGSSPWTSLPSSLSSHTARTGQSVLPSHAYHHMRAITCLHCLSVSSVVAYSLVITYSQNRPVCVTITCFQTCTCPFSFSITKY